MTRWLRGDRVKVQERRAELEAEKVRAEVRAELVDLESLRQALAANRMWLNSSTPPTAAQVVAQVDRLTRQVSTLLRLVGGRVHADLLDPEN
jgi:hypothetical protein